MVRRYHRKIAFEKAGIIRPHIPVIFAGEQSLPQAIQDKANSSQATLYAINRDYFYKLVDDGKHWYFASEGTTLRLPLGTLAIENIAGAVAAVLNSGLAISQLALEEGITNARLAGRFEVRQVNGKPLFLMPDTILMVLNFVKAIAKFLRIQ